MAELNDIPEAVQWHEGMLLAPQHFQQAWLRSEALLGYAMGQTGQFPWGVRRLAVDRALLAGGKFRILALEAVLPDGLAVLHPREDEALLELDLTAAKEELSQAPMAVHLTVPVETARPEPGETRRWRSVDGPAVADANTGEGEVPMPRLRPVLGLAMTEGPLTPPQRRFVSMPIARVGFRDDAFTLEAFAPPRTDCPADGDIAVLTRSLVQRVREKASAIADRLQSSPGGGDLPGGGLLDALRAMVGVLPRMEGLLQAERTHPFMLYLALCDMMGHLSWMGGQPVPPSPPTYRHEDPLPAFAVLVQFLLRMLERVRESYRALRFKRVAEERFALPVDAAMLESGDLVIGARAAQGSAPAEVAEWLGKALIGSRSMMKIIGERRVRGAARHRIEAADELGLIPPAGMVLFRVTVDPIFIVPGQPLEIIGAGSGREPAEIQLFAHDSPAAAKPKGAATASGTATTPGTASGDAAPEPSPQSR